MSYVRSFAIVQAQMGLKLVPVIQNSGVSTVEGFECIEVYGDMVRTFRNVRYIASVRHWGVSVKVR